MNKLLHQETAEALNELLTLTFQENSFADNCAYNLSVMFMMVQAEEIFHEHYAHVFPKWADKISHCLISLGGFPHRGALTINDEVYGDLVDMFCKAWGNGLSWVNKHDGGPHEAAFLKLNNNKIKDVFGWKPKWHMDETINKIVEWTRVYIENKDDIPLEMDKEIKEFFEV